MVTLIKDRHVIHAPTGYSFTSVFFGFFPAAFRADWTVALTTFFVGLFSLLPYLGFLCLPYFVIYPAIYNRFFIARKIAEGYEMCDEDQRRYYIDNLQEEQIFPLQGNEGKNIFISLMIFVVFVVVCAILIGFGAAAALSE